MSQDDSSHARYDTAIPSACRAVLAGVGHFSDIEEMMI